MVTTIEAARDMLGLLTSMAYPSPLKGEKRAQVRSSQMRGDSQLAADR